VEPGADAVEGSLGGVWGFELVRRGHVRGGRFICAICSLTGSAETRTRGLFSPVAHAVARPFATFRQPQWLVLDLPR